MNHFEITSCFFSSASRGTAWPVHFKFASYTYGYWDQIYFTQSEEVCWTTSHLLFSDILQPHWQPDLGRRCSWIGYSIASEPEPSDTEVSPAIHGWLFRLCAMSVALFQAHSMLIGRGDGGGTCNVSKVFISNIHTVIISTCGRMGPSGPVLLVGWDRGPLFRGAPF